MVIDDLRPEVPALRLQPAFKGSTSGWPSSSDGELLDLGHALRSCARKGARAHVNFTAA